jgi:hypothetical protein
LDKIVKFLKQDFFKSFGTRLELLVEKWCEEIQDAEEDQREIESKSYRMYSTPYYT